MKKSTKDNYIIYIVFLFLILLWGSSFIIMKRALQYFPSDQMASLRISFAFITLLPFAIYNFRKVPKNKIMPIALFGIIGNLLPAFLYAYAQQKVESYTAGILNSITPLFTLIIGVVFYKYKTKWYNVLGLFIAFAGAVQLMTHTGAGNIDINMKYGSLIILSTILYALNLNIVNTYLDKVDNIVIISISFVMIGFPSLIYLSTTSFWHNLATNPETIKGVGYVAILGIFGSNLALIAYYKIMKMTNMLFAASITYIMPIVAIFWGIIDGESFKVGLIIWIVMIIFGVFLVNLNKKKHL